MNQNLSDYNQIMVYIEQNFLGRPLKIKVTAGDGPDNLVYHGKLDDVLFELGRGLTHKRVPVNQDTTPDIRLKFGELEILLSGHELRLGSVYDWSLSNPPDSGKYLLCNELDKSLMVYIEKEKNDPNN